MRPINFVSVFLLSLFGICNLSAQENSSNINSSIYLKPYSGFIGIQNMNVQFIADNQVNDLSIKSGFGYTTGIALGYDINKNITTEIGWEYKKNNISITNNAIESNGDYASNFIYVNGIYRLSSSGSLKPYVGLGLSYIQEIDFDFGVGKNASFSTAGDIGFQGIAGLDFQFADRWALNWEAKYVSFNKLDLMNESNNDELKNLKYNPFIFNIGIKFRF